MGISLAEVLWGVEDVSLKSDNPRLVCHPRPFHLLGCRTHDERLARSHLVIADTPAVGLEHPYGILLAFIQVGYAQPFEAEVGESLMRAVEVRAYKTVEQTIIPIRELLLERVGGPSEPIDKALPYLLNLGVRHLYGVDRKSTRLNSSHA